MSEEVIIVEGTVGMYDDLPGETDWDRAEAACREFDPTWSIDYDRTPSYRTYTMPVRR